MTNNELIDKIIKLIKGYVPTDRFGDYGGEGALSDNQVAEMFIDDMIPEIEKLKT